MTPLGQTGLTGFIPPAVLEAQLAERDRAAAQARQPAQPPVPQLVGYIKGQFEIFRNHRNTASGWSNRLIEALRTFNGQYNPTKFQEVVKFGGSQVYARLSAQKCRAASSLLRDIYLGPDRPWTIRPPADPDIPDDILQKIDQLMQSETQMVAQTLGQPPTQDELQERKRALLQSASEAAKKKAREQAQASEDKIEEILREGGFYHALAEFMVDLPIFPFACIKGPVVRVMPEVIWPPGGGRPVVVQKMRLTWQRVSPFDLWWTPGVADIENAAVIEKSRLTRAELNDCLDIPGFNQAEVRAVLEEFGRGGLYDNWDTTDAERSVLESRENPAWNRSQMISQMEYNGNVYGKILQEYGVPGITDPLRDYHIQAWCIGSHVIKVNMSPSPRQRHPYFITSFEKVPGTPVGNGLTDIVADLQEVANATLRSLVNNVSIASGPQVVINDDRVLPSENTDELFPWKRWHARNDPIGANTKAPVEFYQPQDNSQSLIQTFKAFVDLADDVSAIPRYIGGQSPGGAGRTASGLQMLMANASKILQTVAANIDREVFEPALTQLSELVLLTDTSGLLTGEEDLTVMGVGVAAQRETTRQRQVEFLQHTMNPVDMQIMGIAGRGKVLRSVSQGIGLDGDDIVPPDPELEKRQQQQNQQGPQQAIDQQVQKGITEGVEAGVKRIATELTAGLLAQRTAMPEGGPTHIGTLPGTAGGSPAGGVGQMAAQGQGNQPPAPNQSMGPQTNLVGSQPKPSPGGGAGPTPGLAPTAGQ
jgi:hypothetical protein